MAARGACAAGDDAAHRVLGRGLGCRRSNGWAPPRFEQRLRDLGWVEGRTIAIDYRWAEGGEE